MSPDGVAHHAVQRYGTGVRKPILLATLALAASSSCSSGSGNPAAPPADASVDTTGGDAPAATGVTIANLSAPVNVVRDTHGMVHIYASTIADAMRVEGYQMARDRTAQLELIRRQSEGRTAELLGDSDPSLIDSDITTRTLLPLETAQAEYDAMPAGSDAKVWLDAFADGISQFNARVQTGDEALPRAMIGIPQSAYEAWTGADVLAIKQFETQFLSYTGDQDVADQAFADASRAVFFAGATDPLAKKRAGFLVDADRFAPLDPTTTLPGFPNDPMHTGAPVHGARPPAPPLPRGVTLSPSLLASLDGFRAARARIVSTWGKLGVIGSNNWVLGPGHTATGHPMVASDPHLQLSAAGVWWLVQVKVRSQTDATQNVDFAGVTLAGVPAIQIGWNENVAWGATVAFHDVTDVYKETLTPDGSAVVFNGANVPLQTKHEVIKVAGGGMVPYDVLVVPHHGPIFPNIQNHAVVPPNPTQGALSVKWTGLVPSHMLDAVIGFVRAKTVEDDRVAMRSWAAGAQNFVFGDTAGNIFYSTQSLVPTRDKRAYTWNPATFTGQIPCMVLPGDGTAEWTGWLDEGFIPHAKNPQAGYVGTANADPVGTTLDNDPTNDTLPTGDPVFLACHYVNGLRVGRIHHQVENLGHPFSLDDMAALQGDSRSPLGARLASKLAAAIADAEAERTTPGTHPDLTAIVGSPRYAAANVADITNALAHWQSDSDYDSTSGVSADDNTPVTDATQANAAKATLVFNSWLARMTYVVLGDELNALGGKLPGFEDARDVLDYLLEAPDRTKLATYDAASGDSALFDDMTTAGTVESRNYDAIVSLLDAVDYLNAKLGSDRTKWRWGTLHTVHFDALVPLWGSLSIPQKGDAVFPTGYPRHGDYETVDVASWFPPLGALSGVDFSYNYGPSQRMVVDLDPAGPVAHDVIPGGEVWDNTSPHFDDEAQLWRRNQNHAIPFSDADVAAATESTTTYASH
jgi:penicillin amidase